MHTAAIRYIKIATKNDIIRFVYDFLHQNGWNTSFNYLTCNPKKYFSKALDLSPGAEPEFAKYVDYCYLLSNNFTDGDEAARYGDNHGLSIYFSVLLYWLLVHFGVVRENGLKFCQGYFSYKIDKPLPSPPRFRAGVHAWLCYYRSVIDVTIWQQKDHFDFAKRGFETPIIVGEIPQDLTFFGFEEEKYLIKEYARQFARESGHTFHDWLYFHRRQADLLYNVSTK